jgi:uncharacterized protein YdeI (YjbR/CyaY-like superfamily)
MGTRDPRVDAYIAKAAPFARPILTKIRELVHLGAPDIEETIKWGAPAFDQAGMVGGMAAFKAHCAFGFWKGSLVFDAVKEKEAMGQFGRLTRLEDLPPDATVIRWVKKAVELNLAGIKAPRPVKHPKPAIPMPADFGAALRKSAAARKTYEAFPPSHQREYLEWITEAKAAETRARRLATSIEWLSEGKSRMWKYQPAKASPAAPAAAKAPAKKPAKNAPAKAAKRSQPAKSAKSPRTKR